MPAEGRLQRLLGGPALAGLRLRLRRCYELALPGSEPRSLTLSGLNAAEADALQALLGRAPRDANRMSIDLDAIGSSLRAAGLATDLRAALEQLDGPIRARAAERVAAEHTWRTLAEAVQHPALQALLAQPAGLGLLKRLSANDAAAATGLCNDAARVLRALPAHGLPRAALAASCLGDAHALDAGRPAATLVLAVLRRAAAADNDDEDGDRSVWAACGVAVNELARPALAMNLLAADGQPQYWSLRQLLRTPPAWPLAGRDVFVCENPNLLAMAADAIGPRCAPLVCTEGYLGAAQRSLLRQLAAAGARLRYHGDFDWHGITIANRVQRDFGAVPWRMAAADYTAALAGPAAPLQGLAVIALWDDDLAAAMQKAQRAVPEEALFDALRSDLTKP
jgi:uncharacterized protein (TIGR02679 family)